MPRPYGPHHILNIADHACLNVITCFLEDSFTKYLYLLFSASIVRIMLEAFLLWSVYINGLQLRKFINHPQGRVKKYDIFNVESDPLFQFVFFKGWLNMWQCLIRISNIVIGGFIWKYKAANSSFIFS